MVVPSQRRSNRNAVLLMLDNNGTFHVFILLSIVLSNGGAVRTWCLGRIQRHPIINAKHNGRVPCHCVNSTAWKLLCKICQLNPLNTNWCWHMSMFTRWFDSITCLHAEWIIFCMYVNCPPVSNNGTSNQWYCFTEGSSIIGYITTMVMMQDLAACPSGKLGSTSSPAAPRIPPGFIPK